MRIVIDKIVYPGRRMASHEGQVVFTDEGLPGELVEAEIVRRKKNFLEARTVTILGESGRRIKPLCAHYRTCSSYQSLRYEDQIELKRTQLGEILEGTLSSGENELEIIPSPEIWHYRNKARYSILWEEGKAHLAYHRPGSRDEFVKIEDCHLVAEPISELLKTLVKVIEEEGLSSLREVEAKENRAGRKELLLNLFWTSAQDSKSLDPILARLLSRFPLAGVVSHLMQRGAEREIVEWGRPWIEERIGEARFQIGARSFFQVNVGMLGTVIEDMKRLAAFRGTERLGDFYCGLGTFGIALAREVKEVYGVESDPANIRFLKTNIALNGLSHFKIFEGPSRDWVPWLLEKKLEAAVFDPPRKGLDPEAVAALLRHPVPTIIYLSCNPTTLARDLKALLPAYRIKAVRAYDFFPHTPHIETLAILNLR
ncbi:MAG: 23S rRNA (uracil(1939)-C(5))-methyltransferase RlmD [Candidatus Aminicenantes bacterium]|nr:23S rRNA (uracil(1939)-C(5))-methyltransferase RlmD [Candidatus Aminicenantes bacterium]